MYIRTFISPQSLVSTSSWSQAMSSGLYDLHFDAVVSLGPNCLAAYRIAKAFLGGLGFRVSHMEGVCENPSI